MARIRTIKPSAFRDADLYDAEHATGLPIRWAYAGLWTVADRRGRFEWKPRELKVEVLPHDDLDFSKVLDALEAAGFIRSYVVDGREYGVVTSFERHQVPNHREAESTLPAPPDNDASAPSTPSVTMLPGHAREIPGTPGHTRGEGKGREGNSTPFPPTGAEKILDDGQVDADAAWLLDHYPVWYAEERNGARYMLRPALDAPAAFRVCETWPDRQHVERMCRAFLRAVGLPAAHANRSLEVFARSYASGCDAAVKGGAA